MTRLSGRIEQVGGALRPRFPEIALIPWMPEHFPANYFDA
jgi:hypothetical protein